MKKDPRVYLYQILECAEKILRYIEPGEEEYHRSELFRNAVEWNFIVIGEIAKRLPAAMKEELSDIAWRKIAGFRDVLIHGYDLVDHKRVWETATKDMPVLVQRLKEYLPPPEQIMLELDK